MKSAAYHIVFGAPNCEPHIPFYEEVLKLFGKTRDSAHWNIPAPDGDLDTLIEDFAGRVVPAIEVLIKKFGYEEQYFVSPGAFASSIQKIDARKAQGLIPIPAAMPDVGEAPSAPAVAWVVGAYWDGTDMTDTFFQQGRSEKIDTTTGSRRKWMKRRRRSDRDQNNLRSKARTALRQCRTAGVLCAY